MGCNESLATLRPTAYEESKKHLNCGSVFEKVQDVVLVDWILKLCKTKINSKPAQFYYITSFNTTCTNSSK